MENFKSGDWVTCVHCDNLKDHSKLEIGKVYQIDTVIDNYISLKNDNNDRYYIKQRFKLNILYTRKNKLKEICKD